LSLTPLLRPHPDYLALGNSDEQIDEIRAYIQQQRALGTDRFQLAVEHKLGRCASIKPAHRPPAEKAL